MRVALILGVLLILAVNGVAVTPASEPFRPYLAGITLVLSVLVLISLLLPARRSSSIAGGFPVDSAPITADIQRKE